MCIRLTHSSMMKDHWWGKRTLWRCCWSSGTTTVTTNLQPVSTASKARHKRLIHARAVTAQHLHIDDKPSRPIQEVWSKTTPTVVHERVTTHQHHAMTMISTKTSRKQHHIQSTNLNPSPGCSYPVLTIHRSMPIQKQHQSQSHPPTRHITESHPTCPNQETRW